MMSYAKKTMVSAFAGAALCVGGAAVPASAAPLFTGGLVNVTVTDVIDGDVLSNNNVSVGAALGIAANICDVTVNVLATQLGNSGNTTCTSDASGQQVDISQVSRGSQR